MALLAEIDSFCRSAGVSTATFDRMMGRPGFVLSLRTGERPHPKVIANARRIMREVPVDSPDIAPSDEWGDPIRALSLLSPGLAAAARAARLAHLSPADLQVVSVVDARLTFAAGQVFGVGGELVA